MTDYASAVTAMAENYPSWAAVYELLTKKGLLDRKTLTVDQSLAKSVNECLLDFIFILQHQAGNASF